LNAIQKRLFEEAHKKNPSLKIPTEKVRSKELTESDLALLKQGVGDKTTRPSSGQTAPSADGASWTSGEQTGSIVKYFEDKGFGFIRPDNGGKDVFFHISRLTDGSASDLTPGSKVLYEVGMDRTGKTAATSLRVPPPPEAPPPPPAEPSPPA
jgi:CspA family cold shock protein